MDQRSESRSRRRDIPLRIFQIHGWSCTALKPQIPTCLILAKARRVNAKQAGQSMLCFLGSIKPQRSVAGGCERVRLACTVPDHGEELEIRRATRASFPARMKRRSRPDRRGDENGR